MSGFYDLNVPFVERGDTNDVLKKLASVGYKTVAVNHVVELGKGCKAIESREGLFSTDESYHVPGHRFPLRVINRLTLSLTEYSLLHLLSNEVVQQYDVLAMAPTSDKQFQKICTEVEVDIIQLDFSNRLPFVLRLPPVRAAIDRGVHFEIIYSAALNDSLARCNVIANAKQLVRVTRGKNVIVSSGALSAMQVRAPYDVVNLGLLFDWSSDQSKAAVSKHGRSVLCHADARRGQGKAAVKVKRACNLAVGQHWQVKSVVDCRRRQTYSTSSQEDSQEDDYDDEDTQDSEASEDDGDEASGKTGAEETDGQGEPAAKRMCPGLAKDTSVMLS
ncbi:ribonuclease P protein subunit p30-like [Sycon ciliatum]|uniref:ribonuclease P protein subunit p30-like n=1 Tax=Sycon ciliatum TaxID=27933 RepID=UPI0031F6F3C7